MSLSNKKLKRLFPEKTNLLKLENQIKEFVLDYKNKYV